MERRLFSQTIRRTKDFCSRLRRTARGCANSTSHTTNWDARNGCRTEAACWCLCAKEISESAGNLESGLPFRAGGESDQRPERLQPAVVRRGSEGGVTRERRDHDYGRSLDAARGRFGKRETGDDGRRVDRLCFEIWKRQNSI